MEKLLKVGDLVLFTNQGSDWYKYLKGKPGKIVKVVEYAPEYRTFNYSGGEYKVCYSSGTTKDAFSSPEGGIVGQYECISINSKLARLFYCD